MADSTNSFWMPRINRTMCIGCGECVQACPTGALERVEEKASLVHESACIYCRVCEDICPEGAIELPFLIMGLTQSQ